jgi:hypothetical protein
MRKLLIAIALPFLALAGAAAAGSGVYSPTQGVMCDKPAGFCADGTGVSATWTEKYLGAAAAHKLAANMTDPAGFDGSVFGFSNRVYCDIKAQVCTKDKFSTVVNPAATKTLFGKLPPSTKAGK